MNRHPYKNLIIEVLEDPTYNSDSADNRFSYLKCYYAEGAIGYPTSKYGLRIFQDDKEINSCVLIGAGGATEVHNDLYLIDNNQIVICCCDTVFCLTLPFLELKWKRKADLVTCFGIYKLEDDYIVHGEIEISRLSNVGDIKWQFSGRDIFVSLDGDEAFTLHKDHIALIDFSNQRYELGKVILTTPTPDLKK